MRRLSGAAMIMLMCVCTLVATPGPRVADPSTARATRVVGGIAATPAVQAVLAKVRGALGGDQRLLGIRSLVMDGTETFEGSPSRAVSKRLLVPNRMLWRYGTNLVIAIDENDYWQVPNPDPTSNADAHERMKRSFVLFELLFLLRMPGTFPSTATLLPSADPSTRLVAFDGPGGYHAELEVDAATMRPKAITWPAVMTQGDRRLEARAHLVIQEYQRADGFLFPARTVRRMEGVPVSVIETYAQIRVNEGVTAVDFVKPTK